MVLEIWQERREIAAASSKTEFHGLAGHELRKVADRSCIQV